MTTGQDPTTAIMSAAKIISRTNHLIPGKSSQLDTRSSIAVVSPSCHHPANSSQKGKLQVAEYLFEVPLVHEKPEKGNLRLFARSIQKHEKPADPTKDEEKKQLPWCRHDSVHFVLFYFRVMFRIIC